MPVAITVPELRDQPNLDSENDDALLRLKIDAAEAYVSSFIGGPIPDPAPAAIKQAVLMLAAYWFELREAATVGGNPHAVPFGVHDRLLAHRAWVRRVIMADDLMRQSAKLAKRLAFIPAEITATGLVYLQVH